MKNNIGTTMRCIKCTLTPPNRIQWFEECGFNISMKKVVLFSESIINSSLQQSVLVEIDIIFRMNGQKIGLYNQERF